MGRRRFRGAGRPGRPGRPSLRRRWRRRRGGWGRRRAVCPGGTPRRGRECAVDEVAALVGVDAGAGVGQFGVPVAVVGEQAGMGQFFGQGLGARVGSGGVVGGADHQDGVRRRLVPRAAVAVGGDRRPGGTRLPRPGPEASGVARAAGGGLRQGVIGPGVARIGAFAAEHRGGLFLAGVRIRVRDRRCGWRRGRVRGAALPEGLEPGGEVAPSGVDVVEAVHHVTDRTAIGPRAHRMLPEPPHQPVELVPGRLRAAG